MSRILIVDGDAEQSRSLQRLLRSECFVPATVHDETSALEALRTGSFDGAVIGDGPGLDAHACCRRIRESSFVPILILSPRNDPAYRTEGLDLGADDVLTVPFDPRELVARVRAVLRGRREYSASRAPGLIVVGRLTVDTVRREIRMGDRPLVLTHKEYAILQYLSERAGEAVARNRLFEDIWGYDAHLSGKLLEVYIRRVRGKMEPDPCHPTYLQTVRGFGYRLAAPGE